MDNKGPSPQPHPIENTTPSVKSLFAGLHQTIQALRGPEGCPWDQKQTCASLKKYLREEMDELIEAIDHENHPNLCEEIGDLLFLLILAAEINHKANRFSLVDVISGINAKMVRRHPHVFGDSRCTDEAALKKQWEAIKSQEKRGKTI